MSNMYESFVKVAQQAADRAREILVEHRVKYLRADYDFKTKSDASPVTETDERVEREIRSIIKKAFPEHGILGEEYGVDGESAEYVWVIDPIDGTRQFIIGLPVYSTLIALCRNGKPILGVVDFPVTSERFVGVEGSISTLNGEPIKTRVQPDIESALMATSNTEFVFPEDQKAYDHIRKVTKWRVYGGAAYGYASLAAGKVDISMDSGIMREVDYCALVPIIQGAGGIITDWEGNPLTMYSGMKTLAAGDRRMHERIMAEINKFRS